MLQQGKRSFYNCRYFCQGASFLYSAYLLSIAMLQVLYVWWSIGIRGGPGRKTTQHCKTRSSRRGTDFHVNIFRGHLIFWTNTKQKFIFHFAPSSSVGPLQLLNYKFSPLVIPEFCGSNLSVVAFSHHFVWNVVFYGQKRASLAYYFVIQFQNFSHFSFPPSFRTIKCLRV